MPAGRDVPHGAASAAAAAGFQHAVYLAGGLGALSQQHGHVRSSRLSLQASFDDASCVRFT